MAFAPLEIVKGSKAANNSLYLVILNKSTKKLELKFRWNMRPGALGRNGAKGGGDAEGAQPSAGTSDSEGGEKASCHRPERKEKPRMVGG